jgi:ATP-independent RNA helicase DbpA
VSGDLDTHTHRIGRTGRAGKEGAAFSFVGERERFKLEKLSEQAGTAFPLLILPRTDKTSTAAPTQLQAQFETLEITGGRKDKLRPGDILGALTGEGCKLPGTSIGKIEIKDHVSYVAVENVHARRALKSLQAGKIKNRRFQVFLVSDSHSY